jgi:glycosyltransferase involved in cell wall biosynthesis
MSRLRELATFLPSLDQRRRYTFVARPDTAIALERLGAEAIACPPSVAARAATRVLWQQVALPQKLGRTLRPDVVLAPFNWTAPNWPVGMPALVVVIESLAPYAPEIRDSYPEPLQRLRLDLLRRLSNRTIDRADRVLILSQQAYALVGIDRLQGKTELMPMAPPPVTRPADGAPKISRPYFMVIGDLYRYKGVELVLDALRLIPESQRPLLLIAGAPVEADYAQRLVAATEDWGLTEDVDFLGPVELPIVMRLLSGAMGCVVPSRFENLPRVPAEAAAAGTPVIASDIPSCREACDTAALFFELDDPEQLRDHMVTLLEDPAVRASAAAAAKTRLMEVPSDSAARRIVQVIDTLAPA